MKHVFLIAVVVAPLMLAACGAQVSDPPAGGDDDLAIHAGFACSGVDIAVTFKGEAATMQTGGKAYMLTQQVTASGAKYAAEGEPETYFWNKGDGGTLVLEGVEYPDCARTD